MSGVLKRNRSESPVGYVLMGTRIYTEAVRLYGLQSVIPKSHRLSIGQRMVDHACDLCRHTVHAEAFYPSDEHRLWERQRHLTEAMACLDDLSIDLQVLVDSDACHEKDRLTTMLTLLDREKQMLAHARHNNTGVKH